MSAFVRKRAPGDASRSAGIAGLSLGIGAVAAGAAAYMAGRQSLVSALALVLAAMLGAGTCIAVRRLMKHRAHLRSELDAARRALDDARQSAGEEVGRLLVALNNMSQGLCMFGPDHKLIFSNARYADLYGLQHDLVQPGMTVGDIVKHRIAAGNVPAMGEDNYTELMQAVAERGEPAEIVVEQTDGRAILLGYLPLQGGGWVATHQNITDSRRAEAKIAHMARHDMLTDLPNRAAFREALNGALTQLEGGEGLAVLCLDLDRFKAINDGLGNRVGDKLLVEVARRLKRCVRDGDTVARLSGDEFAIIQLGSYRAAEVTALAHRIMDAIGEPYEFGGHKASAGASIGIAIAPGDGSDPDRLMKSADLALDRAKAVRGAYRFFEPDMDAQVQARLALESDLRSALTNGEFVLHYQPTVDATTTEVTGFEALIRWNRPQSGMVPPDSFIPLAEEIGLIAPLGEWVVRQACSEAAAWPAGIKVAVNLSPIQLASGNIVSVIASALADSKLPASRLELEITETVLMRDSESTIRRLHQLRDLGVRISMDDFGTGYSSLSYLQKFPFDRIKIDRSFIRDMTTREDSLAIVRAVAALGRSLGVATTAEGVETVEQLERIREEGCTEVQGFLFSAPIPVTEIGGFLGGRRRLRAVA